MEAHQEKPDDPSDHYGGLREIVMNQQITECIDNLLAAVQSSQEYYEFIEIKENPGAGSGAFEPCECFQKQQF